MWLHELGTDPDTDDTMVFGDGLLPTNYYGVSVSRDGRWLTVSASEGTAPRNDLWLADLDASSLRDPDLRVVQQDVNASTGVEVGRDGRLYVFTDLDAPRGRVCVTTPERPTAEHWRDLVPEDASAVLDGFAVLDGPQMPQPRLIASWTRHAVSELSLHDLATGERLGDVPVPGVGTIGGVVERPEGGHEAWFAYTDHTTPATIQHYDGRPVPPACGPAHRAPSTFRPCTRSRSLTRAPTAPRSTCSSSRATPSRTGRGRPSSTATAASGCR